MATERQIAANKLNAQKSTGPQTEEGKAKSSINRLSHGFASNTTVIPGEDPVEFRGLLGDLMTEHQPITPTEQILVEKMAVQHWLSLRAFRLQTESFMDQMVSGSGSIAPKDLGLLIRYQSTAERAFHKAHNELIKAKKQRPNSEIGFVPQTFGEAVQTPSTQSDFKAEVVPISQPMTTAEIISTFTAADLDFELCPEAIEYLKKTA